MVVDDSNLDDTCLLVVQFLIMKFHKSLNGICSISQFEYLITWLSTGI